jgi:hypothetical protein
MLNHTAYRHMKPEKYGEPGDQHTVRESLVCHAGCARVQKCTPRYARQLLRNERHHSRRDSLNCIRRWNGALSIYERGADEPGNGGGPSD